MKVLGCVHIFMYNVYMYTCTCVYTDLHEEYMSNVEFPHVMLRAELNTLSEYFLYLRIVLSVPVDLSLCHQYWNITVGREGGVG